MIINEDGYVKGNTVIKPQRKRIESDKKREKQLERAKKQRNKRKFEELKNIRKTAIQVASFIFIIGMLIVSRDIKVYNMQKDVTDLNSQIKNMTDQNEALKVDLLKVGTIDNIKSQAEQKLGMVVATKDNRIEVKIPNNYLEDEEKSKQEDKSENETWFSKLMDALK
ncbi:hypothetical protein NNC19_16530 [Clostridium sp. SHJSY1]|uniref:hypothetical protein n=1 Tax=Clostridium sp. SHJSY1 TaxID=2942483 RepID=UPI002876057A|nr:hypothetical protein [Clostridium sp. SHJSY1]MDS0527298.1 hypothetical protein [Clostridium sp. SHJSY1]